MTPVSDIACNYFLGETNCYLPWKHDGDHEPAEVIVVDRHLRPVNGRRVRRVGKGQTIEHARVSDYKGRTMVSLMREREGEEGGESGQRQVNRPAVRVGDRWMRRCRDLEVVE